MAAAAWLSRAALTCIAATTAWTTAASAQNRVATAADRAIVLPAYAESVSELRLFLEACRKPAPSNWEQGAALLVASAKAAGLGEELTAAMSASLSGSPEPAQSYDCAGPAAKARLQVAPFGDWPALHDKVLRTLGVEPVKPIAADDPKLAAARSVIAAHVDPQARLLNCMNLVVPEFFALAYLDWEEALDKSSAAIRAAGYGEEAIESVIGPARSARLMRPVDDRQAEIAGCAANPDWQMRYGNFAWFAIVGEVQQAVGSPQ